MRQEEKTVFILNEKDFEWIDPLIEEWVNDNQGKNQGDFILQLLKEYKFKKEGMLKKEEHPEYSNIIKKEKKDYFRHMQKILNNNLDKFGSGASQLRNKLNKGYEVVKGNVEKSTNALDDGYNKLGSRVRSMFPRPLKEDRESRVKELETELERLQTIVNELKKIVDENDEYEKEDSYDETAAIESEMDEITAQAQNAAG